MLLRSALRRAAAATAASLSSYSSKAKTKGTTTNKGKIHVKGSRAAAVTAIDDAPPAEYELPKDPLPPSYDPALDVGPGGRPLFSFSQTLGPLTSKNAGTYIDFRFIPKSPSLFLPIISCCSNFSFNFVMMFTLDELKTMLPEGLPSGMTKEFEETWRCAVLVRQSFLDLRDNYRRLVDPPVRTGKKDFLKFNDSQLQQLPCQTFEPIPLGEGPGIGMMKGVDSMAMPEGSTLSDLIQTGINYPHASVGVVVRLRKELSLVKDIPVLFAIDQYNNWFTFSEYQEPVTVRSCRPIHARELTTVNAFRSMIHSDMMVGAFSHSTAVGKLRQDLPDIPLDARVMFPRYTLDEAATVAHYYLRQKLMKREKFSEEKWKKIYYLANGNGAEMRWLCPFI